MFALRILRSPDATRDRYVGEIERVTRIDLPPRRRRRTRLDAFEQAHSLRAAVRDAAVAGSGRRPGSLSYLAASRLLGDRATDRSSRRSPWACPTTRRRRWIWRSGRWRPRFARDPASREALLERRRGGARRRLPGRRSARAPCRGVSLRSSLGTASGRSARSTWACRAGRRTRRISSARSANYLQLDDDALAPDEQFERGAREAEALIPTLLGRVRGPRRRILRFFLRRVRALMGSRELPKYTLIRRLFTPMRELLKPVGEELAACGPARIPGRHLLRDTRRGKAGPCRSGPARDVAARRATHARELARRHVPRVLLSDGTDAEVALVEIPDGALRGSPASPGVVTAIGPGHPVAAGRTAEARRDPRRLPRLTRAGRRSS